MDIRQLRAVVTVADVGSVTQAAKVLHVVQPAVTRYIRNLEKEIGTTLFERSSQGMLPTAAGAALVTAARQALRELDDVVDRLRPVPDSISGLVTVGILESLVDLVAAPLVAAVRNRYPRLDLCILTAYSGYLREWLDDGSVDICMLYNLPNTPSLVTRPLVEEPLWMIGPASKRLDPDVAVQWSEILEQPLVMPVAGHGLRVLIDNALAGLPGEPRIEVEVNSMHLQKQMVRAGIGWSILPAAAAAPDVAAGRLSGAPLIEPLSARTIVLAVRQSSLEAELIAAVTTELGRVIRGLVESERWPSAKLPE